MNRNSTAILATAIFFSMLASSGVRPASSPRSEIASLQQLTSSSTKPAHTNNDSGARVDTEIETER